MSLYLIAEVGINHNGSIDIAKKLIEAASNAGFDAVKFQKRTVEKVYAQDFLNSPRESKWGNTQRAQKMGLEFSEAQYDEIDEFCDHLGIEWSASAWDVDSQFFLRKYDLKFNKIASPMLGHKPLLREVASEGRKTYISTGMSTVNEIDEVVNLFVQKKCDFELMHCNSTYPMKEEDANLLCIPMLIERYGVPVGYSGHESSLYKVCAAAVVIGATSIERHITLDRAMYGSDQAASIQTNVLPEFVADLRKIKLILGSGKKEIGEAERVVREKLRVTHD
jgi:N-acetylneuraminate synthase